MPDNKHLLTFHSDAVEDDTLHILELSGLEEISRYYVFTLDLVSKKNDIKFADMLKKPARIEIKHGVKLAGGDKRGQQTLKIHGLLRNFEQVEQRLDWVRYKAELVPPLWKLSMSFQSRCFIEKNVPDIVKEILKDAGMSEGSDFEFRLQGSYPTREFVMQYEESDLDFIDRWLEHEGIFYFWEHADDGSKMVLANATAAYNPMQGTPTIAYNPVTDTNNRVEAGDSEKASDDWFREEIIPVFHCTQKVIPKKVILKEYNWRKPTDELKVEHEVSSDGIGTVYEYNNHYKDTSEGDKLAEARAQEHLCREIIYSGESDCRSFRAGATYTLEKHYRSDFNKEHLLTAVQHTASQTVELASNQTIDAKYRNRFTSIPGDRVFRPVRQTKWPQISGFMNAKVDASGNGQYAEIDDMGRYKVKLPLDLSDRKDGKASRYIRMAQPYAGADMGMHFPLHKGTEVLLTFMDGDPDRPIISSSVPNPDTATPVAASNQTQCKIKTGGGNEITMEDTDGSQRITMKTKGPSKSTFSIGEPGNPDYWGAFLETTGRWMQTVDDVVHLKTKAHWLADVVGNHIVNITGNNEATIKSNDDKRVHGTSRTQILGAKYEFVGGMETKTIVGVENKTNIGFKNEVFVGGGMLACLAGRAVIGKAAEVNVWPSLDEKLAKWNKKIGTWNAKLISGGFNATAAVTWKAPKYVITGTASNLIKGGKGVWKATTWTAKSTSKVLSDAASFIKEKAPEWKAKAQKAAQIASVVAMLKCGGAKVEAKPGGAKIDGPKVDIG